MGNASLELRLNDKDRWNINLRCNLCWFILLQSFSIWTKSPIFCIFDSNNFPVICGKLKCNKILKTTHHKICNSTLPTICVSGILLIIFSVKTSYAKADATVKYNNNKWNKSAAAGAIQFSVHILFHFSFFIERQFPDQIEIFVFLNST